MPLKILTVLFLGLSLASDAQDKETTADRELGTIRFKGESTKLSSDTKVVLDSLVLVIKNNPGLYVYAITYNKDLCDRCGDRSWKRATVVLTYLSKHGISNDILSFRNQLDGELNKVDLFLTSSSPNDVPAPVIRIRNK